jgi:Flp pilus assembly protein TadD
MAQLQALAALDGHMGRRLAVALADARNGRYETALSALPETPAQGPDDSLIQLARGRIYLARAERASDLVAARLALAALEKALAGTARRSEGLALFGRAMYRTGDLAGAERILREAVATSPVDIEAYAFLADAAERLSHPRDARDALVTLDALEGDTASREARAARARRLGMLSLEAQDAPAAARFLKDAVGGGQDDAATLGLLARASVRAGDLPGARSAITRALSMAPEDPDLLRLARTIK